MKVFLRKGRFSKKLFLLLSLFLMFPASKLQYRSSDTLNAKQSTPFTRVFPTKYRIKYT